MLKGVYVLGQAGTCFLKVFRGAFDLIWSELVQGFI